MLVWRLLCTFLFVYNSSFVPCSKPVFSSKSLDNLILFLPFCPSLTHREVVNLRQFDFRHVLPGQTAYCGPPVSVTHRVRTVFLRLSALHIKLSSQFSTLCLFLFFSHFSSFAVTFRDICQRLERTLNLFMDMCAFPQGPAGPPGTIGPLGEMGLRVSLIA